MPYPEFLIAPMREELTRLGIEELRTPEDVDRAVRDTDGTLMIVVNSICGCAAGRARPGIALALDNAPRPTRMASVFAGADVEATDRARAYFPAMPPSSPSVAILREGRLLYMLHRHQIEMRTAEEIGAELHAAFQKFCAPESVPS